MRTIRRKYGDKLTININDHSVRSTIHYVKKSTGSTDRYFVPNLHSIYWLRETLEANNLLVLVKMKKPNEDEKDRFALYLTAERFNTFKAICEYLDVRLALKP